MSLRESPFVHSPEIDSETVERLHRQLRKSIIIRYFVLPITALILGLVILYVTRDVENDLVTLTVLVIVVMSAIAVATGGTSGSAALWYSPRQLSDNYPETIGLVSSFDGYIIGDNVSMDSAWRAYQLNRGLRPVEDELKQLKAARVLTEDQEVRLMTARDQIHATGVRIAELLAGK